MELLLNALWIALALAVPIYWLARHRHTNTRREVIAGLLAFGCIAVLLFPIISASDDVSALQAPLEQRDATKRFHDVLAQVYAIALLAGLTISLPAVRVDAAQAPLPSYSYKATVHIFKRPPPAA